MKWQDEFIVGLHPKAVFLKKGTAVVERFKRKRVWQEEQPVVLVRTAVYHQEVMFTLNSEGRVERHWVGEDNVISVKWSEDE